MPGFHGSTTQSPGPGQYELPNYNMLGLLGKSPLQAAYKNMHSKQKSNAGEKDAKLLKSISKVVGSSQNENASNADQRQLTSNKRGSSVVSPHGDPTQSQFSRDVFT